MFERKEKGQMSLEMIIGLVILLVVATVVVTMFLNVFQSPDAGQEAVSQNKIEQSCESSCQDWKSSSGDKADSAAIKYCTETYVYDANGNNKKDDLIEEGSNSYCEDAVHCFNLHECESSGTGGRMLDAETCNEILCDYFDNDDNLQKEDTGKDTWEIVSDTMEQGSCDLTDVEVGGTPINTWYSEYFDGEDICGDN